MMSFCIIIDTNAINTGLKATFYGPALLVVLEVINLARCIVLLPWLLDYFIEDSKLADFPDTVNKASWRKDLYLPHEANLQLLASR